MKIYIIGCVPAQISYVEKFHMGQNVLRLFNQPYLQNKGMKLRDFLHVNTNSHKFKVDEKTFVLGMFKNGRGQSGKRTQKLAVSQE